MEALSLRARTIRANVRAVVGNSMPALAVAVDAGSVGRKDRVGCRDRKAIPSRSLDGKSMRRATPRHPFCRADRKVRRCSYATCSSSSLPTGGDQMDDVTRTEVNRLIAEAIANERRKIK